MQTQCMYTAQGYFTCPATRETFYNSPEEDYYEDFESEEEDTIESFYSVLPKGVQPKPQQPPQPPQRPPQRPPQPPQPSQPLAQQAKKGIDRNKWVDNYNCRDSTLKQVYKLENRAACLEECKKFDKCNGVVYSTRGKKICYLKTGDPKDCGADRRADTYFMKPK